MGKGRSVTTCWDKRNPHPPLLLVNDTDYGQSQPGKKCGPFTLLFSSLKSQSVLVTPGDEWRASQDQIFLKVFIFLHNFNLPLKKTKQNKQLLTSKISLVCLDCLLGQRTMCGIIIIIIILIFRLYLPNSIWSIFQFLSGDNEIIKNPHQNAFCLSLYHLEHLRINGTPLTRWCAPFLILKAAFEVSH